MNSPYELSANLSLMFTEHPLLERFAAAEAAGFSAAELWWPFAEAQPTDDAIDELVAAATTTGVRLTGLNFFAGDMPACMRGVVSVPERQSEFRDNVAVVVDIATRTGCRHFNALYGSRQPTSTPELQDENAIANLVFATESLAELGGTVLVEPLSGVAEYPIRTAAQAIAVIDAVRAQVHGGAIALLYDTFHLTNNGDDPVAVAAEYGPAIGHVQIADTPGRGQPDTGSIDFAAVFTALKNTGYSGLVACEYSPTVPTAESLEWIGRYSQVDLAAKPL